MADEPQTDKAGTEQADPVPFEDVVAALLKVDPTGIIGQGRKGKQEAADPSEETEV